VATFRHAKILLAQNDTRAALPLLDAVIRARERTPATFYAYACVDAAALYAQMGDRMKAAVLYGDAVDVYGADQRTKEIARRALMQLTTP
jgi:predicted negative regulator of RcsB-dependent stress response